MSLYSYIRAELKKERKTLGRIVTISGPRGVGKTTVINRLWEDHGIEPIVPYTTRAQRSEEVEGRDYRFLSKAALERLRSDSTMFDVLEVKGNYYGTPLHDLDNVLSGDVTRTFNVASHTALDLQRYGTALISTVMLLPTSWDDIREQMRVSGCSPEEITERVNSEPNNLSLLPQFDRIIINRRDDLERTVGEVFDYLRTL